MSILYLDLETADADELWTYGPGFVRLAGYAIDEAPVKTTDDFSLIVRLVEEANYVVGHNILAFDLQALERYHGLDLARLVREGRVIDTLLVARQNDPPLSGKADAKRYGLDSLCRRLRIGGKQQQGGESALKNLADQFGGYDQIPTDNPVYVSYLIRDVEMVRGLARHLVVDSYVMREHKVMWRLLHIMKNGFRVNSSVANHLVSSREARIDRTKHHLHTTYGLPLSGKRPHTTTVAQEPLKKAFRACGVEPPLTHNGKIATSRAVLEALELRWHGNDQLSELCAALRSFNGETSNAQGILEHTGPDDRVRPSISASQATGRISITHPALTGLGKRSRKDVCDRAMLVADHGDVLISADLSQIDARAMAIHSQDERYIDALRPGKDLHNEMAMALFGDAGWDRTSDQHHPRRGEAKAITHGTSYGMGAQSLAQSAGISVVDAVQHLRQLQEAFPDLDRFKTRIRAEARSQVLTNLFGRRVRVTPGSEHTQAPAYIGQSTARDLMMEGVLRLPDWLLPCLRAIVHDELVLSVPADRVDEAEAALLSALQFEVHLDSGSGTVPILAEASTPGLDWADCYRDDLKDWPEVSHAHRTLSNCDDRECAWHAG
ncbi:DNA polymerase [Helcobacillus massiliensis]|uniref:DNA-directed DNA polymerase n=1 Tax=Helcobacillus massiliensis TaxID=521392 RepID=A0A839QQU3_9MICO|nr:DNA polymerase [Helcobacillus massiliensis]MBB3022843.1 DNA polymerase-1 [Helcobacillus massiliensis]